MPFSAFCLQHHLHGIVQQRLGQIIGRLAHEDARAGMLAHEQRQRAGVIVVRVADQDRVDRIELHRLQPRQALRCPRRADACRHRARRARPRRNRAGRNWRRSRCARVRLVKIIANDIPKTARDGYKQIAYRHKNENHSHALFSHAAVICACICLISAAAPAASASAEDQVDQTRLAIVADWLGQIDAGKYEQSYADACGAMHDKVPQDRWVADSQDRCARRGARSSIASNSAIFTSPTASKALSGECMVITYNTSFTETGRGQGSRRAAVGGRQVARRRL